MTKSSSPNVFTEKWLSDKITIGNMSGYRGRYFINCGRFYTHFGIYDFSGGSADDVENDFSLLISDILGENYETSMSYDNKPRTVKFQCQDATAILMLMICEK
jgi:hypothetical protein